MKQTTTPENNKPKRSPRGSRQKTPLNGRMPATRGGRHPIMIDLSKTEIERAATRILSTDNSNERSCVIELLYQYVTLTEATLFRLVSESVAISPSMGAFRMQLSRYRKAGLISNVQDEQVRASIRAGLPAPQHGSLRAYHLGPVGEEYVRRKGFDNGKPFLSATDYLEHDLICAETMLQMQRLWHELTDDKRCLVEVRGPRQVSVWDTEKNKAVVVPDGLLIKRKPTGEFERAFLVEYQNVRALLQVQTKIKKYEEIAKPENRWIWEDTWGLDEMPWVLVIYRQGATLRHYQEQVEMHDETLARYAASSLEDIWAGRLSIKPIRKG